MIERKKAPPVPSRRDFIKVSALAALGGVADSNRRFAAWADATHASHEISAHLKQPASPSWTKDLIIYEIATKGFTSPDGPESGTFNGLRAKLDYLRDLGINGIWLTGYSLCDPHHFYNIWTQYAVIAPDQFDPSLGTAQEFKSLISEAHDRGIKVFLDVVTHGLMNDSPVVKAHPAWFRGSTWGMADFDWNGGHTDLDDWWVKIYSDFVAMYGVDGFRLDVNIYRPDLWERIRQNAAAAGHSIAIWEEGNWPIPGVTDFMQRANIIGHPDSGVLNDVLVNDMPGFYDRKFGRTGSYQVEIEYADHSIAQGSSKNGGELGVRLIGLKADKVGRRGGDLPPKPDGIPDVQLRLTGVSHKPIENITVHDDTGQGWKLSGPHAHPIFVEAPISTEPLIVASQVDLFLATLGWGESSVQLSCHDNGWMGFPLGKNPYTAKGSRCILGYSALFSPMIPIFFSGEEFDAGFHAARGLSPDLYGGREPGKGRWLYGSVLDWNELKNPSHREMFDDVKRMIAIRKQYSEILSAWPDRREPNLKAISYQSDIDVPVPYIRWNGQTAICVAGNRDSGRDANLKLRIPLREIGIDGKARYRVGDLWSADPARIYREDELSGFPLTIKRDKSAGGGIAVFRIDPAGE